MLFPTVEFGLFFLAALTIAWAIHRFPEWHKGFLLAASYVFYGFWDWRFVLLLEGISFVSAWCAQEIQGTVDNKRRKRYLVISLIILAVLAVAGALYRSPEKQRGFLIALSCILPLVIILPDSPKWSREIQIAGDNMFRKRYLAGGVIICLAALVYYKYTAFVFETALEIVGVFFKPPAIGIAMPLLPIGVSFFVFHAISLMADVYRNKLTKPVRMMDALLYVAFFPQLIAGPILRASSFIPQLFVPRNPNAIRVNRALMLIVAGLFKKVIISNTLATRLVEPVFLVPQSYGGWDILLSIYGYAAQIYCDFSGYTDIAIGCALLLGYRLPKNFNAPYTAADPQDFWKRWHISLSSWLRDYLYIPLGGSRGSKNRTLLNLMITMLLGGLWHGAAWTFVIWGALHGVYLIGHRLWAGARSTAIQRVRANAAWPWISRILMFHAVCLGWVFFRAPSFDIAFAMLRGLMRPGAVTLATVPVVLLLIFGILGQYKPLRWQKGLEGELSRWPALVRGAALAAAIILIEILGPTGIAPFIYFQF
jgi:alginate O-acetyltransferase complex protein AlgI